MNKYHNLSVIIVTYNSAAYIKRCLTSVLREALNAEIIIVDNNSHDNTRQIIADFAQGRVRVINNTTNVGFAAAVNQGITQSSREFILLLNPDAELTSGAFDLMMNAMIKNRMQEKIIGGALIGEDGRRQPSLGHLPSVMNELLYAFFVQKFVPLGRYIEETLLTRWFFARPRQVGWVSGGAMLFKKATAEKIGKFDEDYFLYIEDIDFCKRAHHAGIDIYYIPNARIIHKGMASSSENTLVGSDASDVSKKARAIGFESNNLMRYASKHGINITTLRRMIIWRLRIQSARKTILGTTQNEFKKALQELR